MIAEDPNFQSREQDHALPEQLRDATVPIILIVDDSKPAISAAKGEIEGAFPDRVVVWPFRFLTNNEPSLNPEESFTSAGEEKELSELLIPLLALRKKVVLLLDYQLGCPASGGYIKLWGTDLVSKLLADDRIKLAANEGQLHIVIHTGEPDILTKSPTVGPWLNSNGIRILRKIFKGNTASLDELRQYLV